MRLRTSLRSGDDMSHAVFDTAVWKQQAQFQDDILLVKNDVNLWRSLFPFPDAQSNKYTRGHALICGGAVMTGATRLAARAAQRIGAGLVTLAAPVNVAPIYSEALESVIVNSFAESQEWSSLVNRPKTDVLLIGPGLGIGEQQKTYILEALKSHKPIVLDADVFTNFADNPTQFISSLHPSCILTPHEGEFSRLFGSLMGGVTERLGRARQAAQLAGCVVLLKGSSTIIADADGAAVINEQAPAWLATAGSGDVLAGMILGLIAQKMPILAACAAAVWLHGSIALEFGLGMIAEDIIDGIPKALQKL